MQFEHREDNMICKMTYSDGTVIYNSNLPSLHEYIKLCGIVLHNARLWALHRCYDGTKSRLCGVELLDFGYECSYTECDETTFFNGGSLNAQSYFRCGE